MTALNDDALTTQGATLAGSGRILLIACGALAHEVLAVKRQNNWDHLDLQCLPANLHLYPDKITEAVAIAVEKYRADYEANHVLYADCGTGGPLLETCRELGIEMMPGPH